MMSHYLSCSKTACKKQIKFLAKYVRFGLDVIDRVVRKLWIYAGSSVILKRIAGTRLIGRKPMVRKPAGLRFYAVLAVVSLTVGLSAALVQAHHVSSSMIRAHDAPPAYVVGEPPADHVSL